MRFRLVGKCELGVDHELIWSSVAALCVVLGLFALYAPEPLRPELGRCPFKSITGLPCASCGATRALKALFSGDVAGSFRMNPLFTAIYIAGIAYALYGATVVILGLRRIRLSISDRNLVWALRIGVPLAVASNWAYLIWAGI